jgi:hypothetical protein
MLCTGVTGVDDDDDDDDDTSSRDAGAAALEEGTEGSGGAPSELLLRLTLLFAVTLLLIPPHPTLLEMPSRCTSGEASEDVGCSMRPIKFFADDGVVAQTSASCCC